MYWLTKEKDRWIKVIEVPHEKVILTLEEKIQETGSISAAIRSIEKEMSRELRKL